jgi:hypothetical protein
MCVVCVCVVCVYVVYVRVLLCSLKHAYVEKDLPGGMVYLFFDSTADATVAAEGMNGRWFAGRMITGG